jgi:hypothetical protein
MTGSSNRAVLTAALVGALAGLAFTPALAQDAKPDAKPAGPVSILPEAVPPESEAAPKEPTVDVGDLAAPGVDRLGLVDTASGGFTAQLWRGTDLELLKKILPQLPRRIASPTERRLAQNLLLSPGVAPPSLTSTSGDTSLSASQWLLEMRAATLAAIGSWNDVQALLEIVPANQMTDSLKHLKAEAALVTNHVNDACNQAQAALSVSPDPYWQKLQVFCQINMEQSSAAGLGLSLLREQKVEDLAFFWAADVLGGGTPAFPATVTRLEPLHFAMLRKAGATMPANIADVQGKIADPSTLAWLAMLPTAEPEAGKPDKTPAKVKTERRRALDEARILMAERAVAAGTLSADALREIYRAINIKDPAPPPLTQIKADDARGRALLFQSAALQTVPTARAEVIALALDLVRADRGEKGPDLMVMGRIYAPLISEMEPAADHVWFAGTAVRALLATATAEKGPAATAATSKAKAWFDLARNMGRTSREAGQIADALWPMEKIMTGAGALTPEAIQAWSTAQPSTLSPAVVAERRAVMLSLLTGLGEQVSSTAWLPLMNGPARQDNVRPLAPYVWNGLSLAARDKRAGETAALSLIALGDDGPGKASAASLQHVIESLRAVGRDADARALAVEAALVLGL